MLTTLGRRQNTQQLSRLILVLCLTLGFNLASAQNYPNRTVKMIVPLTTGSGADIAGRVVAKASPKHGNNRSLLKIDLVPAV